MVPMEYDPSSPVDQWASHVVRGIGRNIRELRAAKGMHQDELAHASGLSRGGLGNIERGVSGTSMLNLLRIAAALGVSLHHVVGEIPSVDSWVEADAEAPTGKLSASG